MQMFRARERSRGRERARQELEAERRQQLLQGTAIMERLSTLAARAPAEQAGVVLGAVVATLSDEEVLALESYIVTYIYLSIYLYIYIYIYWSVGVVGDAQ
jgi:hypothetical protein